MIKVKALTNYGLEMELMMIDIDKSRYENFLNNYKAGNEEFLQYKNEKGNICTFNPSYYSSSEMEEVETNNE